MEQFKFSPIQNSIEGEPNKLEQESAPVPTIRLEFIRHDEKGKAAQGMPDERVDLTPAGAVHAKESGRALRPDPAVGLAVSSPRDRAQKTALLKLGATSETLRPEMSLAEMEAAIGQELAVGKKIKTDERLNFVLPPGSPYEQEYMRNYKQGKHSLRFLLQDSDRLARELHDEKSITYTRAAADVAAIIRDYVKILPRWEKLTSEKPEKYASHNNELQRFLTSHQSSLEPFLMKVIQRQDGAVALEKFLEDIPDKNGFGFSEGFQVLITESNGEPQLTLTYQDKKWILGTEILEEFIAEREKFDQEVGEVK